VIESKGLDSNNLAFASFHSRQTQTLIQCSRFGVWYRDTTSQQPAPSCLVG